MDIQNFVSSSIINLVNFCSRKYYSPLWNKGPTGQKYLEGLIRDKGNGHGRGSYIEGLLTFEDTIKFLMDLKWHEFTPEAARKGCRYFAADLLQSGSTMAYIGVTTLENCRNNKWSVVERQGEHGPELITHSNQSIKTNRVCIIVEDGMMSTWHPGNPMPETPKEIPDDPSDWEDVWPVKLV